MRVTSSEPATPLGLGGVIETERTVTVKYRLMYIPPLFIICLKIRDILSYCVCMSSGCTQYSLISNGLSNVKHKDIITSALKVCWWDERGDLNSYNAFKFNLSIGMIPVADTAALSSACT